MAQITRLKFSGSTDGTSIAVAATSTPGTLIHTASATAQDEIYLDVCNVHTADVVLTLEFGGTTTSDTMIITIPFKEGWQHVITGISLSNSLIVRAFAATANVLNINGYVLRVA